eukprot:TRINITY_DN5752_c1_g1_i2.p1 TRINITY_DN5752_c1_g1~~TRINITY_DN5752_c1_g1_i2.p1  ORF type:complete len:108 (-),score=13.84 TRINITY_DN5752_c1_g1_i2:122-445(-)
MVFSNLVVVFNKGTFLKKSHFYEQRSQRCLPNSRKSVDLMPSLPQNVPLHIMVHLINGRAHLTFATTPKSQAHPLQLKSQAPYKAKQLLLQQQQLKDISMKARDAGL